MERYTVGSTESMASSVTNAAYAFRTWNRWNRPPHTASEYLPYKVNMHWPLPNSRWLLDAPCWRQESGWSMVDGRAARRHRRVGLAPSANALCERPAQGSAHTAIDPGFRRRHWIRIGRTFRSIPRRPAMWIRVTIPLVTESEAAICRGRYRLNV